MALDRPDVVLLTGGYVGVPVALAARLRGVPTVVFLPDVSPGRAVQLMARLASAIAASADQALSHLPPAKTQVTGYPVRQAVRQGDRAAARMRLGLDPGATAVLVVGGSQGARRLNRAALDGAASLPDTVHLLHVAGERDHESVTREHCALPPALRERYRLFAFLQDNEMADALAASDLVVSRAGASVLGEYPARGLPSVLVPLPIAGGHQARNARVLADAGAAVVIDDAGFDGDTLVEAVVGLLGDPDRLRAMGAAARQLDRPDAASRVWRLLMSVAAGVPVGAGRDVAA